MLSCFGLKPLLQDFSLILSVASRLLSPYSTDGESILHSEGHQERFTKLHEEEERKEGDRGEQEEKKGDSREERQI